ncbi:MAG TPA: hypothetical protein VH988_31890 [Thermoanaerobaculia bacterium]|jgi:hypothetical protein|nr:hypothetical protein [Thermoanaerobaculia bacterium]
MSAVSGAPARRLLGTANGIAERVRVYRTAEALEIDRMEYYNIRRQRVFFDEVQLVTLHAKRGLTVGAVAWGVLALLVGLATSGVARNGTAPVFSAFLAVTAALALGSLISMLAPVWTVTVFGKRTRARIRFRLRGGKARRIYEEICRATAEAQEEAALRFAAQRPQPPPLPPLPPMPPLPEEI